MKCHLRSHMTSMLEKGNLLDAKTACAKVRTILVDFPSSFFASSVVLLVLYPLLRFQI